MSNEVSIEKTIIYFTKSKLICNEILLHLLQMAIELPSATAHLPKYSKSKGRKELTYKTYLSHTPELKSDTNNYITNPQNDELPAVVVLNQLVEH